MKSGGWVTEYQKTREFEERIAKYTGAKYCSVVSNGTISLILALIACGVGSGDEVIVPDYTMVATANAVKLTGAEVVFVDIRPETLCMDFGLMQKALSPHTKAVILVTINGRYPENLEEFVTFCQQNGVKLIEDAAQSLGSFKDGRHLGTFGDMGSFSFSAPKVITTGQGGALVTNNESLIERIRLLRDFGRTEGGSDHYLTMGWNFRFTDIQAVIGIEQMKKLPWRVQRKKEIYALYHQYLDGMAEVIFIPTELKNTSPWFIDILVEHGRRDEMINYLKEKGIGTRPFYPALHAEPVYARKGSYPVAERVASQGLWLPSSSNLDDETIRRICAEISAFYG
jgi:perosamine synthetase